MIERVFTHLKYARKIPKLKGKTIWRGSKEDADDVSRMNQRIHEIYYLRGKLDDKFYAADELVYLGEKVNRMIEKFGLEFSKIDL